MHKGKFDIDVEYQYRGILSAEIVEYSIKVMVTGTDACKYVLSVRDSCFLELQTAFKLLGVLLAEV